MKVNNFKRFFKGLYEDIKIGKLKEEYNPFSRFGQHSMTSINILKLLSTAVSYLEEGEVYLNYGVYKGASLLVPAFENPDKKCLGMDSWCLFDKDGHNLKIVNELIMENEIKNTEIISSDYIPFFKGYSGDKIGVHFADGDHSEKATLYALELADKHMAENSIIIIDDTDRAEVRKAVNEYIEKSDYKVLFDFAGVKEIKNIHMSLAWWAGIMVLGRGK